MSALDFLSELEPSLSAFDLTDKTSIKSSIISVNVAFIVVAAVTITLRLYVRLGMIRAAGFDDILMTLAAAFAIVLSAFGILGAHYGLGEHIWNIATEPAAFLDKARGFTQALYGCYLAYATAITFTKCSIMASYLRLFSSKVLRRVVYATGAVVVSLWLCSIFTIVFECTPVQAAWDWTIADAKCVNIVDYFFVSSSINLVTDIILLVAPIPLLWRINMPTTQRVILILLFGIGAFACVASTLRLSQLHFLRSIDLTYSCISSLNWSVAEVGTAIMCASVPSMRPLAKKFLPKDFLNRTAGNTVLANRSTDTASRKPSGSESLPFPYPSTHIEDCKEENWHELSSTGTGGGDITPPKSAVSRQEVRATAVTGDEKCVTESDQDQLTPNYSKKPPRFVLPANLKRLL